MNDARAEITTLHNAQDSQSALQMTDEEWAECFATLIEGEIELEYQRKTTRESSRLFRRYGINLGDYNDQYDQQGGCCAICNVWHERMDVDHCHTTFRVRGLLCRGCNMLLGRLKDQAWRARELAQKFEAVAEYLGS